MADKKYLVVAIEGTIGSGKSTLADELGEELGPNTLVLQEPDERGGANPYLGDFYEDMARWAFTMQVHLLQSRWRLHRLAQEYAMSGRGHAIIDRSAPGDTAFARLQVKTGAMTEREFATYGKLYHAMTEVMLLPNICIRLLVDPHVALERIQKRADARAGRKCEVGISIDYLKSLDREISHMTEVLRRQGVMVLDTPWDVDKYTSEDRSRAVKGLSSRLQEWVPPDPFLDLHRRTV